MSDRADTFDRTNVDTLPAWTTSPPEWGYDKDAVTVEIPLGYFIREAARTLRPDIMSSLDEA